MWNLVDFRDVVSDARRAGLEAALEASGLLDAWVSPDGRLQAGDDGVLLHDTQVLGRPPLPSSLADWLEPAVPRDSAVPAGIVAQMLSGIACTDDDIADAEAWISPDGRFRLGALTGAWTKPAAVHIGLGACRGPRATTCRDRRAPRAARRRTRNRADPVRAACARPPPGRR